jgi:hypothetical protein
MLRRFQTTHLDRQIEAGRKGIDRFVYKMYRLTDDDISVIEAAHDKWTVGKPTDVAGGGGDEDDVQAQD